ncbi:Hypothetical predicted protein, partial [Olea europaea subsp. europaea]
MIGEAHIGHAEVGDFNAFAHQDEVQLNTRGPRRERGQARGVGAAQPGCPHEQIDLVRSPERVEVTGNNDRLWRLHNQIVQGAKLILAVAEFQGQVHQEHTHVIELELNDQALDAGIEVVEAFAVHMRSGQECVGLLAHNGYEVVDGPRTVLALKRGIVADLAGNVLGLVHHAGTDGTGVDLDEADHIRMLVADEVGNAVEDLAVAAQ